MLRALLLFLFYLALPGAAEAAGQSGMPQMQLGNPLLTAQVVWGAIIFALLYVVLRQFALPRVAEVLAARAKAIAANLETAREKKATADATAAELTVATLKARAEAQEAIAAAIAQAHREAAEAARAFNARLEAEMAEAEARIGATRAAAMGALHEIAGEIAALMVARLTGAAPDKGRIEEAVGRAVSARSPR